MWTHPFQGLLSCIHQYIALRCHSRGPFETRRARDSGCNEVEGAFSRPCLECDEPLRQCLSHVLDETCSTIETYDDQKTPRMFGRICCAVASKEVDRTQLESLVSGCFGRQWDDVAEQRKTPLRQTTRHITRNEGQEPLVGETASKGWKGGFERVEVDLELIVGLSRKRCRAITGVEFAERNDIVPRRMIPEPRPHAVRCRRQLQEQSDGNCKQRRHRQRDYESGLSWDKSCV